MHINPRIGTSGYIGPRIGTTPIGMSLQKQHPKRPPPTIATCVPGTSRLQIVEDELMDRNVVLQLLRDNLVNAQARMKMLADKKRPDSISGRGLGIFETTTI